MSKIDRVTFILAGYYFDGMRSRAARDDSTETINKSKIQGFTDCLYEVYATSTVFKIKEKAYKKAAMMLKAARCQY